jgi:hypothetical protein
LYSNFSSKPTSQSSIETDNDNFVKNFFIEETDLKEKEDEEKKHRENYVQLQIISDDTQRIINEYKNGIKRYLQQLVVLNKAHNTCLANLNQSSQEFTRALYDQRRHSWDFHSNFLVLLESYDKTIQTIKQQSKNLLFYSAITRRLLMGLGNILPYFDFYGKNYDKIKDIYILIGKTAIIAQIIQRQTNQELPSKENAAKLLSDTFNFVAKLNTYRLPVTTRKLRLEKLILEAKEIVSEHYANELADIMKMPLTMSRIAYLRTKLCSIAQLDNLNTLLPIIGEFCTIEQFLEINPNNKNHHNQKPKQQYKNIEPECRTS